MNIGYKGTTTEPDAGYFFAPYWPGMSDEQRAKVDADLAVRAQPPTELQNQIMKVVRGEHK